MTSPPAISREPLAVVPLTSAHGSAAWSFLSSGGLQDVYLASQVWAGALETRTASPEFYGAFAGEELRAVLYLGTGGLAVPAGRDAAAIRALGELVASHARSVRALIGPLEAVDELVPVLRAGGAEIRTDVAELFLEAGPGDLDAGAVEPGLRAASLDEVDLVAQASSRAHVEEMGTDPIVASPAAFVGRVARQVLEERVFVLLRDGAIVFKAEVSAKCPVGAQISGVYTHPAHRGRGHAGRGTGELARRLLAEVPRVCLFVRADNQPARRVYDRIGFRHTRDYRTLFFREVLARG
jgi:hypothetical protein